MSARQTHAAIEFAKCMRAHRVPNFPDPMSSPNPTSSPSDSVLILQGLTFPHISGDR
jgi:hypothetical protein